MSFIPRFLTILPLSLLAACAQPKPEIAQALHGDWEAVFHSTTDVGTNGVECSDGDGHFTLTSNLLMGFAHNEYNQSYTVVGMPSGPASVNGQFFYKKVSLGTFEGSYADNVFSGTFVDTEMCRGIWTARMKSRA